MADVKYKKLPKKFSARELKNFIDDTFPGKTLKQCQNIIKHSTIFAAFDKDKIIGIGRALDDTVYAFITDIVVHPKYRRRGVGSEIVKKLCKELIKKNVKMIHCSTDKKFVSFYQSAAGFKYDPNDITLYLKNF